MQQTRARNRERTVLGLAATLAVGAALAAVVLSTRARNVVTQQKANAMTVAQYEIGRESRQQLFSYSGKKSQEDMNSYFDSLPHLRSASRAVGAHLGHSKEALKVSDDGLPVLPVKRMHEHVHAHEAGHGHKNRDAFATDPSRTPGQKELNLPGPANDGLPVLLKKSKSELENRVTQEHEINKAQLQSYKLENPSFKKNLDEVHKQWMAKHDNLPASKSEKKEYNQLVFKIFGTSIGDVVRKGVEEPRPSANVIKAQIAQAQAKFAKHHKIG